MFRQKCSTWLIAVSCTNNSAAKLLLVSYSSLFFFFVLLFSPCPLQFPSGCVHWSTLHSAAVHSVSTWPVWAVSLVADCCFFWNCCCTDRLLNYPGVFSAALICSNLIDSFFLLICSTSYWAPLPPAMATHTSVERWRPPLSSSLAFTDRSVHTMCIIDVYIYCGHNSIADIICGAIFRTVLIKARAKRFQGCQCIFSWTAPSISPTAVLSLTFLQSAVHIFWRTLYPQKENVLPCLSTEQRRTIIRLSAL